MRIVLKAWRDSHLDSSERPSAGDDVKNSNNNNNNNTMLNIKVTVTPIVHLVQLLKDW